METPSFTFRLERVRTIRERAEDRAREDLSNELRVRAEGEALLDAGRRRRRSPLAITAAPRSRRSVSRPLTSSPPRPSSSAPNALRIDASLELARREAEVAVHREVLAAAARDRQAIDKLKERQKAEHDAEWARKSQNTLDELALAVHRRGGALAA